ncbi:hypothetical protein M9H77_12606 [Catharanthus roseus]|uniref:Uncharacterized protein n=1 Tax=Catharanthus roseus TaxID=4058 RepID=A0ACC0BHY1_CATRO|nr:hypothetical protein M9H77_12606 [Catharanthus roseus]
MVVGEVNGSGKEALTAIVEPESHFNVVSVLPQPIFQKESSSFLSVLFSNAMVGMIEKRVAERKKKGEEKKDREERRRTSRPASSASLVVGYGEIAEIKITLEYSELNEKDTNKSNPIIAQLCYNVSHLALKVKGSTRFFTVVRIGMVSDHGIAGWIYLIISSS